MLPICEKIKVDNNIRNKYNYKNYQQNNYEKKTKEIIKKKQLKMNKTIIHFQITCM